MMRPEARQVIVIVLVAVPVVAVLALAYVFRGATSFSNISALGEMLSEASLADFDAVHLAVTETRHELSARLPPPLGKSTAGRAP